MNDPDEPELLFWLVVSGWMKRKRLREGFLKATAPPNEVSRSLGNTHVNPLGHDNDRMRRPSKMDERN
jgi:hypothetical protein